MYSFVVREMDLSLDDPKNCSLFRESLDLIYTPFYCEENVWHLAKQVAENINDELHNCFVVFISNEFQTVKLWNQKLQPDPNNCVIWDYHVIFVHKQNQCFVYDFDSTLPFPVPFDQYMAATFRCELATADIYRARFRIVTATSFLASFASDRHHMIASDGTYLQQPPNYPPISTLDSVHNLDKYIDVKLEDKRFGEVISLSQILTFFGNS